MSENANQLVGSKAGRSTAGPWLSDAWTLCVLTLVCACLAYSHWLRFDNLWGDPGRSIFEAYRTTLGEVPYKDFSHPYSPLSLYLVSGAMKLLGAKFSTVALCMCAIGVAFVVSMWRLCVVLFPSRVLRFAVPVGLTLMLGKRSSELALFSLWGYTHNLHVGAIGMAWYLIGIIRLTRSLSMTWSVLLPICSGSAIGMLSKAEFMMAIPAVYVAAMIALYPRLTFEKWARLAIVAGAATYAIPASVYAAIAASVGPDYLIAGLSGYGLGGITCPWWPTLRQLVAVAAVLLQGFLCLTVLKVLLPTPATPRTLRSFIGLGVLLALNIVAFTLYLPLLTEERNWLAPFGPARASAVSHLFVLSTGLLPVFWLTLAFLVRYIGAIRRPGGTTPERMTFVLLGFACLFLSFRSLFSDPLEGMPKVAAAAYPFVVITGVYLLHMLLRAPDGPRESTTRAAVALGILIISYGLLRSGTGWYRDHKTPWVLANTRAGAVWLSSEQDKNFYDTVAGLTSTGSTLTDFSYGGALNFAAHLRSPAFLNQYRNHRPAQFLLDRNLRQLQNRPPDLAVVLDREDWGMTVGVCGCVGCTFPRIVWQSDVRPCDSIERFGVIDFIHNEYTPAIRIGDRIVMKRQSSPAAIHADSGLRAATSPSTHAAASSGYR
jgi:hypothetical protein